MAAKIISSFTFLKKALILPTLNPKLFATVLLLFAGAAFLDPLVQVVFFMPLVDGITSQQLADIKDANLSDAEFAKLVQTEVAQRIGNTVLLIGIARMTVAPALGLVKQILALSAASTTYSGDRHSLAGLLRELVRGGIGLKGPSITIAVVGVLDFTWAVLAGLRYYVMHGKGSGSSAVLSVEGLVSLLAHLASLCFTVVALVGVAASVADKRCRGVRALRQAWKLVTRVRRKEGLVLVLVAYLGPTVVAPLHRVALGYAKSSMAACLFLTAVYALLSGAQDLFSLAAATVYYHEAMESKEVLDALWLC